MPHSDVFASLLQRLIKLVGTPAALELARGIPGLVVDDEGNVLDYNRQNPRETVRQLLEHYESTLRKSGAQPTQPPDTQMAYAYALGADDGDTATPAKIMVVDDHELVREGLAGLIDSQPDMEVVGRAGSVREALLLARSARPDIILMDFTLLDGTGDEATRIILSTLPNTKIVFLTVHDDDERLLAAISAGAVGYLLKSIRSSELIERLRGVIRGDVALSPTIGKRVLEKLTTMQTPPALPAHPATPLASHELTEREQEILRLIVGGHTNRQIADTLKLSVRTVEYHRANLTSKLGLHTRAELVRYAAEHGLIGP